MTGISGLDSEHGTHFSHSQIEENYLIVIFKVSNMYKYCNESDIYGIVTADGDFQIFVL